MFQACEHEHMLCCRSASSEDHHPELPESDHRPVPHQDLLHLQGGEGAGLPVLRCGCLGAGRGLQVSTKDMIHHTGTRLEVTWCIMSAQHSRMFNDPQTDTKQRRFRAELPQDIWFRGF